MLKPDTVHRLPALTKEALLAGIDGHYSGAAARRIRGCRGVRGPALRFSRASPSAGHLCAVQGFSRRIFNARSATAPGLAAFTDFYWDEVRVAGEFDGIEKYLKPEYLQGRTASQAVVEEKLREDRIRAAGNGIVRWVWADLMAAGRLEGKLAAAGVPRRRALSAG